ncbi:MAG: hypothetical protein ACJ718_11380 [Nitrososphaeraceae archaeon]
MNSLFVSKVQDHEGLNTNLDNLYNSIKQLLEGQKDVKDCFRVQGASKCYNFKKYSGVNKSPKVWAGSLREIHVSITGNPDDYAVEVASRAWFW